MAVKHLVAGHAGYPVGLAPACNTELLWPGDDPRFTPLTDKVTCKRCIATYYFRTWHRR